MRLLLDVEGLGDAVKLLDKLHDRGEHLQPVLDDIGDRFLDIELAQFRSEGTRSRAWAPLAPSTVRQRGSAHPILDDTGTLRRSLTLPEAPDSVRRLTATSLLIGTEVEYARYHVTGTRNPDGTVRMPRRPPVALLPTDEDRFGEMMSEHLLP